VASCAKWVYTRYGALHRKQTAVMGQCYALLRVVEEVVVSLTKDETHPNKKGGSLQPHAGHDYAGTSQANGVAGRPTRTEQASALVHALSILVE
jgi:hypothetical protein